MKKHKILKIVGAFLALFALFMLVINIIPPKQNVEYNPFKIGEDDFTMIAAHRAGAINNPEHTMKAYKEAVYTYEVDIIESDLRVTKDDYLVLHHSDYIDFSSNVNGDISLEEAEELCKIDSNRHYICNMTLEELKQYNFAYYFEDGNGERIYKDATDLEGLQIVTLDELFDEFYESHPDLLYILEVKDPGDLGIETCVLFDEKLKEYPNYEDQVVVSTFHPHVEKELEENYPHLLHGAALGSAKKFLVTTYLGVNLFNESSFACLQIPESYDVGIEVGIDNSIVVNRAHRRNIAVQYWTINDEEEMRKLIEIGADCIMTDNPKLLKEILSEYKNSK